MIRMEHTKYIKNNLEISNRLGTIASHIFQNIELSKMLLLKGGFAVQLYLGEFKRLFFDIDFDTYSPLRESMMDVSKIKLREQLLASMEQLGYYEVSNKSRFSYSLDSYQFPYYLSNGTINYAKIEINYSFGSHLYVPTLKQIVKPLFAVHSDFKLVNLEELIGMKLKALLDRGAVKDLYDLYYLINQFPCLDLEKIKKAYIFYFVLACPQNQLCNYTKIHEITNKDMIRGLYPLIEKQSNPKLEQMKDCVLSFTHDLLNYHAEERYFIEQFYQGNFVPEYLFSDDITIEHALSNPIAQWKTKIKQRI